MDTRVLPDHALAVVAREDDVTFGILQSRFHVLWSLRLGTSLEDRPRYTPSTCFETFPFPKGLTPRETSNQKTEVVESCRIPAGLVGRTRDVALRIARAGKRLNDLREGWLNPTEWVSIEPEVVPLGMTTSPYPQRVVPRPGLGERELKQLQARTMTNLYNEYPDWLASAHQALDAAVAVAYGFDYTAGMTDEQVHALLLAENRSRAGATDRPAQMSLPLPNKIPVRAGSPRRRTKRANTVGKPVQPSLLDSGSA